MFVEMMLAIFALVIAGTVASFADYSTAIAKGPGAIFAGGVSRFLGALGCLRRWICLWQCHDDRSRGDDHATGHPFHASGDVGAPE